MDTATRLVQHLVPQQRMSNRAGMLSYLRKFPRLSEKDREAIAAKVAVERGRLKDSKVACPAVEEVMLERIFTPEELEHLMGDDLDAMGRLALLLQQESWTTKAVAEARLHLEISSEMWTEALELAKKAKIEARCATSPSPKPEEVMVLGEAASVVIPAPDEVLRTQSLTLIAQKIPADEAWRILAPPGEKDEFNSRYVGWGGEPWTAGVGVGTLRGRLLGEKRQPIPKPKKKKAEPEEETLVVRPRKPRKLAKILEETLQGLPEKETARLIENPDELVERAYEAHCKEVFHEAPSSDPDTGQESEPEVVPIAAEVVECCPAVVDEVPPEEVGLGGMEEDVSDPVPDPGLDSDPEPVVPTPDEKVLPPQPRVAIMGEAMEGPAELCFLPQPDGERYVILQYPDRSYLIEGIRLPEDAAMVVIHYLRLRCAGVRFDKY